VEKGRPDLIILGVVLALLMIGLVMVYSAKLYVDQSYMYLANQAARVGLGILALGLGFIIPKKWLEQWFIAVPLLVLVTLALVGVLFFGKVVNNARRTWFGIQFSEFAKPVIVLFLAWCYQLMSDLPEKARRLRNYALVPAAVCAPAIALTALEPAVSMALIIAGLMVVMLYLAEVKLRYIAVVILIGGVLAGGTYYVKSRVGGRSSSPVAQAGKAGKPAKRQNDFQHILNRGSYFFQTVARLPRVKERLAEKHAQTDKVGYQQWQSWIGVGSGGITGQGPGNGKQKFYFLPMVATDFIFALIGEEFGFLGSIVIFTLFLVFLRHGLSLVRRAQDTFTRLALAGMVTMITSTALVHLLVNLCLIPPTGQTLPFVSYGLSAMAANMFGVGVILNLSQYLARRPVEDDFISRCRHGWAHLSGAGPR
jgi:cell division protein FtsW